MGATEQAVSSVLQSLAGRLRLALLPGTDSVWMAHPFSAVETDYVVRIGPRQRFADRMWDGLSILALLGDGTLDTHCAATRETMQFAVDKGSGSGEGLVHFLAPARSFWVDIGFTEGTSRPSGRRAVSIIG